MIVHAPSTPYDLLQSCWLPVGSATPIGLRELFATAHGIADIEVPNTAGASGLWRILTVIAGRITDLDRAKNRPEWRARRAEILDREAFDPDRVKKYFDDYHDRFRLFDAQRPFLQDPRLREQCGKRSGINKLVLTRPAGNNQVWFDHHTDLDTRPIPPEEAIWFLLAQLYYGPSGRCTSRTVSGRNEANSTAGPLRGTVSFHPLGRNVFESLVAGIPYPGRCAEGTDLALWERDELPHPLGLPPEPVGLGGVLTGRFRHAVLLSERDGMVDDAWITWAWRQPTAPVRDPYLIYQENPKTNDLYARGASSARALWRDVDALLLRDVTDDRARRPEVLDEAEHLPFDLLDALRVRAFGFDQDGQTRDRQWFTAATPPVLSLMMDPEAAYGVSVTRVAAERVARHLRSALRTVWVAINDPSNGVGPPARKDVPAGPWREHAAARYWPQAENVFWRKVWARTFDDPALDFIQLALGIYDNVTEKAGSSPRARKAIERARGHIFAARNPGKPKGER